MGTDCNKILCVLKIVCVEWVQQYYLPLDPVALPRCQRLTSTSIAGKAGAGKHRK